MRSKLLTMIAAAVLVVGFALAVDSTAEAGGKSGGKVTGALDMVNPDNGNETRRQFMVQEREGNPARGMVSSEVLTGPSAGNFFEGDVVCAIVNAGVVADVGDFEAIFSAELTNVVGWAGPPSHVLTFVYDGGEPSVALDELQDTFISVEENAAFCAWVSRIAVKPPVVDTLLGGSAKESIGGGNLQVHLD